MADTIGDSLVFILLPFSCWTLHLVTSKAGLALTWTRVAIEADFRDFRQLRHIILEFQIAFCGRRVRHPRVRRFMAGQVIAWFGLVGLARDLLTNHFLLLHTFLLNLYACAKQSPN